MRTDRFAPLMFEYILTIVPVWRVCDECWRLSDESYLCGIGITAIDGIDALVGPLEGPDDEIVTTLFRLVTQTVTISQSFASLARITIVRDDRVGDFAERLPEPLAALASLRWSDREALEGHLSSYR